MERRGGEFVGTLKLDGYEKEFALRVVFKPETTPETMREAFERIGLSAYWTLMYEHMGGYVLDEEGQKAMLRAPTPEQDARMREWSRSERNSPGEEKETER